MRKILLSIDALNFSSSSIDLGCFVASVTKSKLTGIFLENLLQEERNPYSLATAGIDNSLSINQREAITTENIRQYQEYCSNRGVEGTLHRDRGIPISEMLEESRFADLLIADPSLSFKNKFEGMPSTFVKTLLEQAECPVLLAPQHFEGIDEIIFTYDNSKSSVYAIRQFNYLFPEWRDKKITIAEAHKLGEPIISAKPRLSEWMKLYYSNITYEVLRGEVEEALLKYLIPKKNILLVMGAYGRGILSSLLKESRANAIVRATDFPIFITHH